MITGSGTKSDPFLIDTWDDLISSRAVDSYVEWIGGDLDFNDIRPQGYTSKITIYGRIDFHNATFRNFRGIYANTITAIEFNSNKTYSFTDGGIFNLKFVNMYITRNGIFGNDAIIALDWYNAKYPHLNVIFTGRIDYLNTSSGDLTGYVIRHNCNTPYGHYTYINGMTANFEITATSTNTGRISINVISGDGTNNATPTLINSDIEIRMNIMDGSSATNVPTIITSTMLGCRIRGIISRNGITGAQIIYSNTVYGYGNVFLLEGDNYHIYQGGISVYNSDTMSLGNDSTTCIGCTEEQLKDNNYLRKLGFPIGVD